MKRFRLLARRRPYLWRKQPGWRAPMKIIRREFEEGEEERRRGFVPLTLTILHLVL
jgi:hypothetical protein